MSPHSRREFLRNGVAFVSFGASIPTFLMSAAQAQTVAPNSPSLDGKILVVIELGGGNDGLNTIAPFGDPEYRKLRPKIGIQYGDSVHIDANLGLHPRMKPLMEIYEKGHLGVVTGVGYPNPNLSHFESMDIWQLADPGRLSKDRIGWLARYFDADGHLKSNPLSGVTLTGSLPLAFSGESDATSVYSNGQDDPFAANADDRERSARVAARLAIYEQGTLANSHTDFIRKVGHYSYTNGSQFRTALSNYDQKANKAAHYPVNNDLANSLQSVSKLIVGGLPTRVYYVSVGGFDTHANQPDQHANLLGSLSEAIAAFYRDLDLQGRSNDVALMTFSEFGRRAGENASLGTDHGTASVMLVAGGGIKGGVHGQYPSLKDLKDGDLRFTTDFRRVYANLLEGWLAADSAKILGAKFDPIGLV